jgi:Bacterial SH3 domain
MQIKWMLLGAGAALVLSAGAASAAIVTGDLNLRSGPGTDYSVIDAMPAGARVAVLSCSGSWCQVNWRGEEGYASRNFLAGAGGTIEQGYYNPGYDYGPGYAYYDDDYGDYGPGVVFGFGGGYYGGHDRGHHHHGHHHFAHNGGPGPAGINQGTAAMSSPDQANHGHHFHGTTIGATPNASLHNSTVGAGTPMVSAHVGSAPAGGGHVDGGHAMAAHDHH